MLRDIFDLLTLESWFIDGRLRECLVENFSKGK
jgi:hypothetical protein